jgi:hypothetical protein
MLRKVGRGGSLGLALAAWDVWRRIPPAQRRQLIENARVHGPRIVKGAYAKGSTVAKSRRPPG